MSATGWIQTFTGVAFYPLDPKQEDIRIEDIAHALAGDFRFGRHMRQRYTTAQHSVYVSMLCPTEMAMKGLLHDGSEAYLVDIPRPVKQLPEMQAYRNAEGWLQDLIYDKFCGSVGEPPEVKAADTLMLGIEARDLMQPLTRPDQWEWCVGAAREHPFRITRCWPPEEAEDRFLERFDALGLASVATERVIAVREAAAILGRHAASKRKAPVARDHEELFTEAA